MLKYDYYNNFLEKVTMKKTPIIHKIFLYQKNLILCVFLIYPSAVVGMKRPRYASDQQSVTKKTKTSSAKKKEQPMSLSIKPTHGLKAVEFGSTRRKLLISDVIQNCFF
jgi:hypothetical protein